MVYNSAQNFPLSPIFDYEFATQQGQIQDFHSQVDTCPRARYFMATGSRFLSSHCAEWPFVLPAGPGAAFAEILPSLRGLGEGRALVTYFGFFVHYYYYPYLIFLSITKISALYVDIL